ncbi:MAG: putative Ribosomal small subunit methyltransferase [Candidatus Saccharibacteria bacterium]|nr:putative Ribosomal small subunit methyltransferase [Candidatus Saccharibacteria bacterium]
MPDLPHAKKSLGQHWLRDETALAAMCDAASVVTGDFVLEIGPGAGTLTQQLLARGAEVRALEFDADLIPALQISFHTHLASGQMTLEQGDIRTYDFSLLPPSYKIVANIPYYLTSNLIQLLSESSNPPSVAALLVQKEVAERVVAEPGRMSLLSVTAQFYWQATLGRLVPAELFMPPPKVDSQILVLSRRPSLMLPDGEVKAFFRLVKAGYSQRRKTLLNSLSGGLRTEKDLIKAMCASAEVDPARRAQTLSLEEWHNLYLVTSLHT